MLKDTDDGLDDGDGFIVMTWWNSQIWTRGIIYLNLDINVYIKWIQILYMYINIQI
jgi:hypothetical protein